MKSIKLTEKGLKRYDCVVIITNHSLYDYQSIVKNSRLVVDTRNATGKIKSSTIIKA
jgi:UDP-N-acetyl-D-glucosamine dehydrogenase